MLPSSLSSGLLIYRHNKKSNFWTKAKTVFNPGLKQHDWSSQICSITWILQIFEIFSNFSFQNLHYTLRENDTFLDNLSLQLFPFHILIFRTIFHFRYCITLIFKLITDHSSIHNVLLPITITVKHNTNIIPVFIIFNIANNLIDESGFRK